ncbi:hypothetical protein N234_04610 [Ralstonia pickettii DTP0602]|nr:hypothetical protein N234_04610 [Ralstonia pickettii DTP0602]
MMCLPMLVANIGRRAADGEVMTTRTDDFTI